MNSPSPKVKDESSIMLLVRIDIGQAIGFFYIILVVLASLYVPWKLRVGTNSVLLGHSFLWSPPGDLILLNSFNVYVDWVIVLLEIIALTIVALLLYAIVLYWKKIKFK